MLFTLKFRTDLEQKLVEQALGNIEGTVGTFIRNTKGEGNNLVASPAYISPHHAVC